MFEACMGIFLANLSTQKAFSRFVGAIVEMTRRMRAVGDLN
jgi:hypothetical protein